ncbi:NAD(P)-dependent oxidoreductase [Halomonas sp. NO4]|uniref:NAD(P)-dependent oxidoreductase n=1 Tax=Halomonas sp. NO4 TaxID=2484813 RepID=UPI0013CFAD2C|nr:NAD(P)-dependent oxidoreductase [Halomonas sp. NO4]
MSESRQVGMIGVGLMGHGIASNLLKTGHRLHFLDHPGNQPVEDLLAAGAERHTTARAVAESAEVVLLCVTGSPQVEAVLFAPDGVLEGLAPGTVVIDCSTALPSSTARVAERVVAAGGRFMDAAMTRTPKEAAEGRLNLIVGASPTLFEEWQPLLACFAETITRAGDTGAGHTLKLVHNFVSLGFSAVLAEATAASRRAGIADAALLEVLGQGAGAGVILERLRPFIEHGDPSAFRFSVANASKDLGYYHATAEELGAPGEVAGAVQARYAAFESSGLTVPELIDELAKGRDESD